MTLPYAMGDEQPFRRLQRNSTELLCKLGSILYRLETLNTAEAEREQLLKDLVNVEAEMEQVKGLPAFRYSNLYGINRKPENNKLLIRALSYMVYATLFRNTPCINIMHLAQAVVNPDAKEDVHIGTLELRRLLALQVVDGGALRIQEEAYEGQGHPLTPYIRLSNNVLIQIMGGDKCLAVLNTKTIEAVREEKQNRMLDIIEENRKKKAMISGYEHKAVHLPADKFRQWKRQSNGGVV